MIPHTVITVIWMVFGALFYSIIGPGTLLFFAAFITGWWWSREQYLLEYRMREVGWDSILNVIGTIFSVWNPLTYKNWDLIAPVITTWVLFFVFRSV